MKVTDWFADGRTPATDVRKQRCRSMVGAAIKRGELPKLDGTIKCTDCPNPAKCYDHRDYGKPLKVDPVCKMCDAIRGPGEVPPEWGYEPVGRQGHRVISRQRVHQIIKAAK